jgi:anti-sigma B factor antagonist
VEWNYPFTGTETAVNWETMLFRRRRAGNREPEETKLELKIRKSADIYIIDVNGEMDLYNSYKLKELVMKMLEKKIQKFIINMENVEYIDSSGIGALIYICSTIKKLSLKLLITNVRGSVKKVIELTKLMGYFPITGSVVEAVKELTD